MKSPITFDVYDIGAKLVVSGVTESDMHWAGYTKHGISRMLNGGFVNGITLELSGEYLSKLALNIVRDEMPWIVGNCQAVGRLLGIDRHNTLQTKNSALRKMRKVLC